MTPLIEEDHINFSIAKHSPLFLLISTVIATKDVVLFPQKEIQYPYDFLF